jgi:TolB-like protein
MMALRRETGQVVLAFCLLFTCSLGNAQTRRARPNRTPAKPVRAAKPPEVPLNVAVFPFWQTVGSSETATLGQGIADSLSNALKGVSRLAVADLEALYKAAGKEQSFDALLKDDDAIRIGQELGLTMVIVGSYQSVGNQLIINARVLNAATAAVLPGSAISLNGRFPEDYANLLNQLNTRVLAALRVQPTPAEAKLLNSATISQSSQVLLTYNHGLEKMRQGTVVSLEAAIGLFDECLKLDPAYGLAYAARAEAGTQLAELKQARGENSQQVAQQAVSDATAALRNRSTFARAQRALARAQNAAGNYDQAAAAARRAVELSPNDAAALIALARALNGGELKRTPQLDRIFHNQPWITFMFDQLPKVFVKNDCDYVTTVSFATSEAESNPTVTVQPHAARVVAIMPGTFTVTFDCDTGDLTRQYELKKGEVAELTFRCRDILTTKVNVRNAGNSPAYVAFIHGTRTKTLIVNPGGTEVRQFQIGSYTITCSGTSGGSSLKSQEATLRANAEYTYSCDVIQRLVPRRIR